MVRKQVYIERRQDDLLKRRAEARGVTQAELIREALDLELAEGLRAPPRDAAAWEAALGTMMDLLQGEGSPRDRDWRREDLYEQRLSRHARPVD